MGMKFLAQEYSWICPDTKLSRWSHLENTFSHFKERPGPGEVVDVKNRVTLATNNICDCEGQLGEEDASRLILFVEQLELLIYLPNH